MMIKIHTNFEHQRGGKVRQGWYREPKRAAVLDACLSAAV